MGEAQSGPHFGEQEFRKPLLEFRTRTRTFGAVPSLEARNIESACPVFSPAVASDPLPGSNTSQLSTSPSPHREPRAADAD